MNLCLSRDEGGSEEGEERLVGEIRGSERGKRSAAVERWRSAEEVDAAWFGSC